MVVEVGGGARARGGAHRGFANKARGEQVAAGWPAWLSIVAGDAINGWIPRVIDMWEEEEEGGGRGEELRRRK